MSNIIHAKTPLTDDTIAHLRIGNRVLITGIIYTARDAAHKRLVELADQGKELPFDVQNQIIYYVGPSPARPGRPIGSCGPTTSYRMDVYTPTLLAMGLKATIGKGNRSERVIEAMKRYKAVYFVATGGAAALLAKRVKKAEVIAYHDLGAEAIMRLEVEDFPVVVANDIYGNDLYSEGMAKYQNG
ncbi:MAG: Fe-S-containing hydro-lyase [Candidatus Brocadia sp.]|jgi:hydro-lyases, Fe-S type, tartrate/fumarate subfamily, beta region|uniref:Fumarate hydratase beta subunit n=1 Tax=Candidatus Brocadia fulgida TaxID=380242 RepID=A0A0M2UT17_9BACT|nr:MAG: fumarate hydratase beta subunit [Candidatus Brocadia fulgida]MCC6324419.1 Fe-S-containing hydro-lyase [Candidatus Brocadia sp.]MCE7910519.1 Fe-S-containing hydro-lyase [Candidatus Brocadia sp. AMX3]OQZ00413.1 MAG: fumarate hydratase [Candidatus Brocadia sp. UTAMX2]MBV6518676.1 Fumarate hydratase class I, anaerobic [Candidatus Brocadia fulgida]